MEKEKNFSKPVAEIIEFSAEDIILTSVLDEIGEDDPIEH